MRRRLLIVLFFVVVLLINYWFTRLNIIDFRVMQDPLSQQLHWNNKPTSVLIIKKLGDNLNEQFKNMIKFMIFVSISAFYLQYFVVKEVFAWNRNYLIRFFSKFRNWSLPMYPLKAIFFGVILFCFIFRKEQVP